MKLYRFDEPPEGSTEWVNTLGLTGILRHAVSEGTLVLVEPCVHGKYGGHEHWFKRTDCEHPDPCESYEACPGAGLDDFGE